MSIIGYIRVCSTCGIRMIVTAEAWHQNQCTPCLDAMNADAIDAAINEDPDWPVGEVRG